MISDDAKKIKIIGSYSRVGKMDYQYQVRIMIYKKMIIPTITFNLET